MIAAGRQRTYDSIGKHLPAPTLMARGLTGPDRERSVEQQHALLGPSRQIARLWHRCTKVKLYLLENIDK